MPSKVHLRPAGWASVFVAGPPNAVIANNHCTFYSFFFTAETAEVAEKTFFILNLSGLGVLCG
jgi:hypothetical protein